MIYNIINDLMDILLINGYHVILKAFSIINSILDFMILSDFLT